MLDAFGKGASDDIRSAKEELYNQVGAAAAGHYSAWALLCISRALMRLVAGSETTITRLCLQHPTLQHLLRHAPGALQHCSDVVALSVACAADDVIQTALSHVQICSSLIPKTLHTADDVGRSGGVVGKVQAHRRHTAAQPPAQPRPAAGAPCGGPQQRRRWAAA